MTFKEYRVFGLFLYNQIDIVYFKKLMREAYDNFENYYLEHKWMDFNKDPMKFLMDKEELFNLIQKEIRNKNYKG